MDKYLDLPSYEDAFQINNSESQESLQESHRCERVLIDGDYISYLPDDDDKPGVYIAEDPLTSECSYYEAEIIDIGLEGTISIGLCSQNYPLDAHIGHRDESISIMSENGRLYKDGVCGPKISTKCECGDKIGCGIKFNLASENKKEPFSTDVPVYFVRNGKELATVFMSLPNGGLYPAIGMQSVGEDIRLLFGINWITQEETLMSIDTNEDDWYRLNDIRLNGQILEYIGRGKSIVDVGLAQARCPLNTTIHYFEIEIIDPGECCYIAIGLTRRGYPKHRHPGWNKGSIGYHADDGKIFIGSGVGDPFGPLCYKGDIMGCGILFPRDYVCSYDSNSITPNLSRSSSYEGNNLLELSIDTSESEEDNWEDNEIEYDNKVKVFFTRNGKIIGKRQVSMPKGGFFPTIGMLSIEEKVRVDLRPLSG